MGATVVDTSLTAAAWAAAKPKDYKGGALTSALKAYETAAKTDVLVPAKSPKRSVSAYEDAAKTYKTAATTLKKHATALATVASASTKTTTELRKMADKTDDKHKKHQYKNAAGVAQTMGLNAARMHRQMR